MSAAMPTKNNLFRKVHFARRILLSGLAAAAVASAPGVQAQVSRDVVQPTPTPELNQLNDALLRLARDSRNVSALIDAGNAALKLGDLDAAMGFFGRAQELSPANPEAKMGMAAVFVRSDRPVDALRLFAEAERAGASPANVRAERGLAYDLVGNAAEAQASYRAALATGESPEITRRLAISQAIAGDRKGFEATLLPLLRKQDLAAYRSRAFGLAILGDVEEATSIANTVMPKDLAGRISPYLAYMPRLTKSQQAAAANLGIFPRAAEIGRDDPRIAQYAGSSATGVSSAGAKLAPQGAPLGAATSADKPVRNRTPSRQSAYAEAAQTRSNRRTRGAPPSDQATPAAAPAAMTQSANPSGTGRLAAVAQEQASLPQTPPVAQAAPAARPAVSTFDLARTTSNTPALAQPASATAPAQASAAQPVASEPERLSVADAFAGLATSPVPARPSASAGAVDITTIEVPREAPPEPKEPPKPEPPKHPSRHWVQVATGRDVSALKFDWRRFARKAPELLGDYEPHVVRWGEANRLLAGPVPSAKAARELMNALKQAGVDSFTYTSPEGEEIKSVQ